MAAELEGDSTGVGRYLTGLLDGLDQREHDDEWHLFFQGDRVPADVGRWDWVSCHCSGHTGSRVLWEHLVLRRELARHDLDVVFGPGYSVPLGYGGATVVAIHDLSFELFPEEFGFRERWRRRFLARRAARTARAVLVLSNNVRDEIIRLYGAPEDSVQRVPPGVDCERFNPRPAPEDNEVPGRFGIRGPFLLWLGSVFDRRAPDRVVEAFAALRDRHPDLQLVIAGANRLRRPEQLSNLIAEAGLEGCVTELGWVDEKFVAPLYRKATAGIYVSRYEGFGLPPLECLACGTPVVASPGLGLDDLWPDYPYRCRDLSANAISATLDQLLETEVSTRSVTDRAPALSGDWGWRRSARILSEVLRRAAQS